MGEDSGSGDAGELSEDVERALDQLPKSVRDALAGSPEVRDALAGFEGGITIEGADGLDLEAALAGTPIEPKDILERLPGVQVEGIDVTEGAPLNPVSTKLAGGPRQKLEVRFSREAYAPGDAVEGVIVAHKKVKARQLRAGLCYVEQSPDYAEQTVHDDAGTLHKGNLEPGTEIPFSFRLPPDALPNWDPAGAAAAAAGRSPLTALSTGQLSLAAYGRLYWGVVVTATRRGVIPDRVERHAVPLVEDGSLWGGPEPEESEREVNSTVKGWDVEIDVDRWTPRRGDTVTVGVSIDKPSADRDGLRVGLVGEVHYDVETTSTDGNGNTTSSRSTRIATAHEEWAPIDPASSRQQVRLQVPEQAPFSYSKGKARKVGAFTLSKLGGRDTVVAIEWKVVAREDKRMRRDPRREARLHVLP